MLAVTQMCLRRKNSKVLYLMINQKTESFFLISSIYIILLSVIAVSTGTQNALQWTIFKWSDLMQGSLIWCSSAGFAAFVLPTLTPTGFPVGNVVYYCFVVYVTQTRTKIKEWMTENVHPHDNQQDLRGLWLSLCLECLETNGFQWTWWWSAGCSWW